MTTNRPTRAQYEAARARHAAATTADHTHPSDQLLADTALINAYDHACTCREEPPGTIHRNPHCPNHSTDTN